MEDEKKKKDDYDLAMANAREELVDILGQGRRAMTQIGEERCSGRVERLRPMNSLNTFSASIPALDVQGFGRMRRWLLDRSAPTMLPEWLSPWTRWTGTT